MRGIVDPVTDDLFKPFLVAKTRGAKPGDDGVFKFKLGHAPSSGLTKATGQLSLRVTPVCDSKGDPVLVGSYEFQAKRANRGLDNVWEESIRAFRVDDAPLDDPAWPDDMTP